MSNNKPLVADIVEVLKRHPGVETIRVEDYREPNAYFYVTRKEPPEKIRVWDVQSYEVEPGYWCYMW